MIEYKIVKESGLFQNKLKAIEKVINELAKEGWRAISVSFTDGAAYATMERDTRNI